MPRASSYDAIVIGGGIAGASCAWALARGGAGRVLLLEAEAQPGFHTTGRSAAFLVESYGNPTVQRLTRASRPFLESPPDGFASAPVLAPRPSLTIARSDQAQRLADDTKLAMEAGARLETLRAEEARELCPVLRPGYVAAAVYEPGAQSIDVDLLLQGFLRDFRAAGGTTRTGQRVQGLEPRGDSWSVDCADERFEAPVVVNAAGAWGEVLGRLAGARPVGLRPLRRTAITFDPPPGLDHRGWPCVIDADEDFYLKPEAGQLLASPCDETPSEPCDASPDDLAVALAAERVARATTIEIRHVQRRWAGLRSFVRDRAPVVGMDGERPGFFWLVGQGGFGIMTSASLSRAAAGLVLEGRLPRELEAAGLCAADLSPERESLAPDRARPVS